MKQLMKLGKSQAGKLSAGTVVKAVIRSVNPPHPDSKDKQPVVLTVPPGDDEMNLNIYGDHLHLTDEHVGKVIEIELTKDGAGYLTVFDDGGRCLTLRDGCKYSFRDLDPSIKMKSPLDRLDALADHYAFCYRKAHDAMDAAGNPTDPATIQPIASCLFIETKAGITAKQEPKRKSEVPSSEPEPKPNDKPAPEPEQPTKEEESDDEAVSRMATSFQRLHSKNAPKFYEKAADAITYSGEDRMKKLAATAATKACDQLVQSGAKIWQDTYMEIWERQNDKAREALDASIMQVAEKYPDRTESTIHRAVCLLAVGIIKAAGKDEEI